MAMNIVVYHANCSDGFTSAFVAYLHFKKLNILDDVEFVPMNPRETPDIDVEGKNVVMFDVCLDKEALHKWNELALNFKVLDHHDTNQIAFGHLSYCHFDQNKSGAGLAWDYYNKGEEAPWWVQYTQDRDLYTWKLPNSRAVNSYLVNLDFSFSDYEKVLNMTVDQAAAAGRYIFEADWVKIQQACRKPTILKFLDYTVPIINSRYFQSEIGNELVKIYSQHPFAIVWYETITNDGERVVQLSFRSVGDFHVGKIAQRFGGGGHKNAGGVRMPLADWLKLIAPKQKESARSLEESNWI